MLNNNGSNIGDRLNFVTCEQTLSMACMELCVHTALRQTITEIPTGLYAHFIRICVGLCLSVGQCECSITVFAETNNVTRKLNNFNDVGKLLRTGTWKHCTSSVQIVVPISTGLTL